MVMKFAENELHQITEDTWRIVLGEELKVPVKQVAPSDIDDSIAACAQITGDWQLAVVLYCSSAVARRAATLMFHSDDATSSIDDVNDVMCELINIIAGNIKGVLSGSSHLSLPNLVKGQDFKLMFPRHVLLSEANFVYQGEPLLVMLLGEDRLGSCKETPYDGAPEKPVQN
jgi:CheY-specific phosphatase CheX